jgi:hypothetical protein
LARDSREDSASVVSLQNITSKLLKVRGWLDWN